MFNEKQTQKFLDFYHDRYKEGDESILETSFRIIEEGIYGVERDEIKARKEELTKILGKKRANSVYKIRSYGPQSVLEKVFGDLYSNYGPKYIYNFCNHFPIVYAGREKLVEEAFSKITKLNTNGKAFVGCFKEKYGSFRTEYEEGLTDEMRNIFNKLIEDTYNTCAICGRKGEQRNVRGRFTPLCYYHSVLNYISMMGRKLKRKIRLFFKSK